MFQAASLVVFHILLLIRLRFEVWPETLLMPYLADHGFALYRDMAVPWTPGLMWLLAGWFWLTGLTVWNLKILTWITIAVIDILIYSVASKRWGKMAGIVSLAGFILLQPLFDGNGLWFDLAVVPLLLLAFHFNNPIFLGPAFLIKQSVVWLFPLFWKQWRSLAVGIIGFTGLSLIYFKFRGNPGDYWFWAYDFTFRLFPRMPGHLDFATWRHWALALVPFLLIGLMRAIRGIKRERAMGEEPLAWAGLAILFALPRFGLFHFQPALAFLSLALGKEMVERSIYQKRHYLVTAYCLLLTVYLSFSWLRVIQAQWQKPDRFLEPEVYQTAAKMVLETDKNQPVLLVNGPELAYVLSGRLPPKPWLTQFPWFLELPGFQEELIDKFKQQNLRQILMFPYQNEGEFVPGSYRPVKLLEYINSIPQ